MKRHLRRESVTTPRGVAAEGRTGVFVLRVGTLATDELPLTLPLLSATTWSLLAQCLAMSRGALRP